MALGELVGLRLKSKFEKLGIIKKIDRVFGALLSIIIILVSVWFGAAIFNKVPVMGLQQQIRGSRIVTTMNNILPSAPRVIAQIGHFINPNGFPQVFTGIEPKLQTDAPLPELGELLPAVEQTRASVVKIAGEGCGGVVEGTGFIAGDGLVITNAHVVAGVTMLTIIDTDGSHKAEVIGFDPKLDIAVVRTMDSLAGRALALKITQIRAGTKSVVLGYPSGAGFTASPAVVLETITATGRDIYNADTTQRSVHTVKADIRHGNSGGPLIGTDGSVIGVVFAESTAYPDIGYALAMEPVIEAFNHAKNNNQPLSTGACAQ